MVFFLSVLILSLSAEEVIELNINNEDVEVRLAHELNMGATEDSRYYIGAFFMNSNDKNKGYNNSDDDKLYGVDFTLKNRVANTIGLEGELGFKVVAHDNGENNLLAAPLGAGISLRMEFENFPPTTIGAKYYYAPEVLTLIDGSSYNELRFEWKVELVKNGEIAVGYRAIGTDYIGYNLPYNTSMYAGIILHIN